MLQQNDPVPLKLEVLNDVGEKTTLGDLIQKTPIVLYFYPKDNTPGCITEACDFRDYNKELEKLGYRVIGVSKDTVKSHLKFKDKHNLKFPLIADPENILHQAFGVIKEKSMFGKKYLGTQRSTFIISQEGTIVKVWDKVKASGHAKEVYDWLHDSL